MNFGRSSESPAGRPIRVPLSSSGRAPAVCEFIDRCHAESFSLEDDAAVRHTVSRILAASYEVDAVASAEEALSRFVDVRPEVVLTDIRMPGMD